MANLFEAVFLIYLNLDHIDSGKQFGFKEELSCNHAGYVLQEAINLSIQNNKKLYVVAIDASKAFDKLCRQAVRVKIIRRNLNPAIIISIMNYYNVSQMMVMNDDDATDLFKTTMSVRQGGTISPKLFNIYVEDIINK